MALTKIPAGLIDTTAGLTVTGNLTGTTTTQAASDNTTKLASTAYVTTALANLADSAPSTLNTLNELAAALGDDASFSTTVTNSIALKAPLASPTFTGDVKAAANATGAALIKGVSGNQTDRNTGGYPQYTFVGNQGTGMRRVSENVLALDAGGAEALRIDSAGHVGIGMAPAPVGSDKVLSLYNSATPRIKLHNSTTGTASGDGAEINMSGSDFILENREAGNVRLFNNGAERMRIASGGNVGIGELSPANKLHVKVSDAGIAPHPSAQIVLERDGTNYLQFLTTAAGTSGLLFGDTNDIDVSKIYVDHNTTKMTFVNEATETMTLNGNKVGIGLTAPMTALHVQSNGAPDTSGNMTSGIVVSDSVGGPAIKLSCHNSAGYNYIQSSYVNNANVGRDLAIWRGALEKARVTSTGLQVTSTGGTRLKVENTDTNWAALDITSGGNQANYVFFKDNSAERARIQVSDGNDISFSTGSSPSEKLRIRSGGGITFNGDTSADNTLDDYEEGNHTATITCASGTITLYSTYNNLEYTKIGRLVHIQGKLAIQAVSSPSGATTISLPFAIANLADQGGACSHLATGYFNGGSIHTGFHTVYMEITEGQSYVRPYVLKPSSTAGNAPGTHNIGDGYTATGSDIYVNFSYIAA